MKRYVIALSLITMFLLPGIGLFAQEEPHGVLIYAGGSGFELIRDGETREYDLSVDIAEGVELQRGDYLNTYEGTFLEIQLLPSENVLKVSENSSFRLKEMTPQGGGNFELTYGRVRARVEKMAGLEQFSLEGPSMVAGVRGTDFGYDIVYERGDSGERTVATVYCFDGEVEVETTQRISDSSSQAGEEDKTQMEMQIGSDEMVRLAERYAMPEGEAQEPGEPEMRAVEYVLVKETLSESIRTYWNSHDFEGRLIESRLEEKGEEKQVAPEVVTDEDLRKLRREKLRRAGAVSGGLAVLFGSATLTFAYADNLLGDMDRNTRESLTLGLGATTGMFLSTSLFSYLFSLR